VRRDQHYPDLVDTPGHCFSPMLLQYVVKGAKKRGGKGVGGLQGQSMVHGDLTSNWCALLASTAYSSTIA
jgi:hypothetical protein